MTLYDYVRLFQREWRRLLATFLVLVCGASLLPLRLYVATLPTYQATLLLLVPEKARERTIAQLNSQAWGRQAGLRPGDSLEAKANPLGLIRVQVVTSSGSRAGDLGRNFYDTLRIHREQEQSQDQHTIDLYLKVRERIIQQMASQTTIRKDLELAYAAAQRGLDEARQEWALHSPGELIDGPVIAAVPRWTGWKFAQALISIVVASVLISVAMVLVREWWRLETERRT